MLKKLQLQLQILVLQLLDLKNQLDKLPTENGKRLFQAALIYEGQSLGNNYVELGCAEEVNAVAVKAFGKPIGGDVSTTKMYNALRETSRFFEVLNPIGGDIVISPTGYGNGKVKNGHVGIYIGNNVIMSNNSENGKLERKYTLDAWKERYAVQGGFPMKFYRVV